jgi:hypothetical protein
VCADLCTVAVPGTHRLLLVVAVVVAAAAVVAVVVVVKEEVVARVCFDIVCISMPSVFQCRVCHHVPHAAALTRHWTFHHTVSDRSLGRARAVLRQVRSWGIGPSGASSAVVGTGGASWW